MRSATPSVPSVPSAPAGVARRPLPLPPSTLPGVAVMLALAAAGCATTGPGPDAAVGQVTGPVSAPTSTPTPLPPPVAANPPPIILTPPVVGLPNPLPVPAPTPPTPPPARPPLLALNVPKNLEQAAPKPAVLALYRQAQAAQQAGQLDQASAALERALRLDARNGWLYQALAQVNLSARRPEVAQGQAQKALSLSRRNPFLELSSLRTLEAALTRLGNAAQAAAAAARASLLESRIREAGGRV